ncbi:MAG: WYL domain-containing protein [Christensenella sp.]
MTVTLTASPKAMEYWALQYGVFAEIIEPQHLRDSIKEKIAIMAKKYE